MVTTYPDDGETNYGAELKAYIDGNAAAVNVSHYGATGDGSTDDTAAFVSALASGARTVLVPDGVYIVNKLTMTVAGQSMVLSPGATLKAKGVGATNPGAVCEMTAANTGMIGLGSGATIDGNGQGTSAGTAIYAHGSDQVIQGLTFVNLTGHAVNAQGDRALIDRNTITDPGNAGVFVANVSGTDLQAPTVSGNRISVSGNATGIQIHVNPTGFIYRPRAFNNDIVLPAGASTGVGIEMGGGNKFGSVFGNTIEGSQIGISIDTGTAITVSGNAVHGAYSYALEFASCAYSTISGNTVDGNGITGTGISLVNSAGGNNTVTGNTVCNLTALGAAIHPAGVGGSATTITGNNVSGYNPIVIGGLSGHTVTGNVVTCVGSGTLVGISFDNCTNSVCSGNTIVDATTGAVQAFSGTMNGLVIGPNILAGTTTTDLYQGWTPGTNGTGSRMIRGNATGVYGLATQTVGASPWTFTNSARTPMTVYVRGGTVSNITMGGFSLATASPATLVLNSGESIIITYTAAPTVNTYTQ